jgi:hypothetical protein
LGPIFSNMLRKWRHRAPYSPFTSHYQRARDVPTSWPFCQDSAAAPQTLRWVRIPHPKACEMVFPNSQLLSLHLHLICINHPPVPTPTKRHLQPLTPLPATWRLRFLSL